MIGRPSVELIRLEENFEFGTFGVLRINKSMQCLTLEPRDELNAANVSSIPAQQYICKLGGTSLSSVLKLGLSKTYQVMDVPNRTGVKLHPGNTDESTEGCILLGSSWGKWGKERVQLNSGRSFKAFMEIMLGITEFHLTIKEEY